MTKDDVEAKIRERMEEASRDPVVFIDRFLDTFDPKTPPYHLPFRLFDFQMPLVGNVQEAIQTGHDLFIEKSREMGATYTVLDVFLWFWRYVPGSNFLLGSRKQDYVDNTKGDGEESSNKEESLFGKLEYTLGRLPGFMKPKSFDPRKHLTFMSLINPENGNAISGESANPNFSRGGRFKAILFDEFAFWDNDGAAWGAAADATRCRIALTTPGIRPNTKAKRLRFGTDGEQIKVVTLGYALDPRKTPEWLEYERGRRSEEDFAREIMINWETSIVGRVYEEIRFAKVGVYPYNPHWPLYVSWDFGLDGVAIQWWQLNLETLKPRLIDAYENSDRPIQWYFPFMGLPIDSTYQYTIIDLETIDVVKLYKKAIHFGDPDVAKRSLLTGTSTRQTMAEVGIYVQTRPDRNDFTARREMTKVMLQNGIEVNDTRGTRHWLECVRNARYPQRQETSQATTAVTLPIHDWTSHHRTSTEYFAVNKEDAELLTRRMSAPPPAWVNPKLNYNNPASWRR